MLFINDDDTQTMKDNSLLDQGVRTDGNIYSPIGQAGQNISSTFGRHAARQ